MSYDFSHLYKTETVNVGPFEVVIREIPHGEFVGLQNQTIGKVSPPSSRGGMERQLQKVKFYLNDFQDRLTMAAIQSWTLTHEGEAVPVCLEAWHALPQSITTEIERVISRLNPEPDDEFPGEPGSNGATESGSEDSGPVAG